MYHSPDVVHFHEDILDSFHVVGCTCELELLFDVALRSPCGK